MRHSRTSAGLSAVLLILLAGCASTSGSGSELSSQDVTGEWVQAGAEPRVYLELAEGGALSGSDGCNQLTGGWEIDGSEIDFGELGSTMMACEDVDTWLSGAESATVSGDQLTVLGDGGDEIGTLERSS